MTALLADAETWLPLLGLISLRIGVALALMPAPFGTTTPATMRMALGVLLALVVGLPVVATDAAPIMGTDPVALGVGALGEVLVGSVIGLTARVTLAAAHVAGTFVGTSIGLGFASSIDPTMGEESLPTSTVLGGLATVVFLAMQGHHQVIAALSGSLEIAPPGAALHTVASSGLLRLGEATVAHGLRIAAPVVATMFIVNVGTALVARVAPRLNVFTLTFSIAIGAGLLVLFVSAASVVRAIAAEVGGLRAAIDAALLGG